MSRIGPSIAAALALLVATPAFAGPRDKKAILVLRVEAPNVAPDLVTKLDAAARQQVGASSKGAKLLPPPALDFESMKIAGGCGDDGPECLANIGGTLGATQVIRIVITPVKERSRVTFTFVTVKNKKAKTTKIDLDAISDEAIEEFRWNVASALGDKKPLAPGGLLLTAADADTLDGVDVFLDDRKFPLSALKNLPPGEHRLEVHKEGFETFIWTGAVRPGRETKIQVKLDAIPGAPSTKTTETPVVTQKDPPPVEKTTETPKPIAQASPPPKAETRPAPEQEQAAPPITTAPAATTEVGDHPSIVYTWIFAGGAAVATGVGVFFWRRQADIESQLEAECMGEVREGRFVCLNQSYVSCKSDPERDLCVEGRSTQTATLIAFPLAGALAAGALAAFLLEDGPTVVFGGSRASSDEAAITGAAIIPLEGGAAAALSGRY